MPDRSYTGIVSASGSLTITIQSRPERWRVTQVSVRGATAPSGSTCLLKKNGVFITPIIATGGAATEPPAVELDPFDSLTIEFTGMTQGTLFEVFVIYDVIGKQR